MKLTNLLYRLIDARRVDNNAEQVSFPSRPHHMLLVVIKGSLTVKVEDKIISLCAPQVLSVPPSHTCNATTEVQHDFECVTLTYNVYNEELDGKMQRVIDPHLEFIPAVVPSAPVLAIQIHEGGQKEDPWAGMARQILFQELCLVLLKQKKQKFQEDTAIEAVKQSQKYINTHYQDNFTREKLAELAGLSVNRYSRLFKKMIGQGPIEYLNAVRIREAGDLLLTSDNTIKQTARQVGYEDEFYFSRKFKATTGLSPMVYIKKHRSVTRIASLAHPYTGHLLALGIEPYAALINPVHRTSYEFKNVIQVGKDQPDLELLMNAHPELIIGYEGTDYEEPKKAELFRHIASTCTISFAENWRKQLYSIAQSVGKITAGEEWLERYDLSVKQKISGIQRAMDDRPVAVAQYEDGQFRVYGNRNLGTVLYDDLQLSVPQALRHVSHSRLMSLEQLVQSDIEHFILFTSGHAEERTHTVASLMQNSIWQQWEAVRMNQVYELGDSSPYSCYTSLAHNLFLNRVSQLFLSQTSMH
ncbi:MULTISPECIES: AraC family transcriptional regulator [unclassified Paenibacillus]|uniref:AraC family transcriptional regulator n=1 Tax=unclassified Paenibacillus TaxID=185978 RepID=UPI000CFAF543|nr:MULTISPECIES: AraC family transcriptional regulator [unclassified Paenibacillus]PRA01787.1 AraC family transcriptional regulator [Paenibacillus sp. MYb63]PRA44481.1 AraC family transcriptional regulator [Paenibacillus sp. MYb67]QZN77464.1 AraC family transcriptional regulator [Paenibacillus sp. DR312]